MVVVAFHKGYEGSLHSEGSHTAMYIKSMDLTYEELFEAIDYNPETGKMVWKINPCRRIKAGAEVGTFKSGRVSTKTGKKYAYRYVRFKEQETPAGRVAWMLTHREWPETVVQYKDDDPSNLRLDNLELGKFPTVKGFHPDGRKSYKMSKEAMRHNGLRRYYGLTPEQYGDMIAAQKGLCTICGKPETAVFNGNIKTMHVDHCHKTNMLRDLLCGKCNGMLGLATDDPAILRAAADYIERHAKRTENVVFIKGKGSS